MNARYRRAFAARRLLGIVAVVSAFSLPLFASADVTSPVLQINADAATAPITSQALRGNISVLMGSGGNIGVLNGRNGKLLVDAGISVSRPRLVDALNGISQAPIEILINTHYHWDHTDGNPWVHDAGAKVIAHENTLKRLSSAARVIEWGYTFPPLETGGLPTEVVHDEKTIPFEGETVVLKHYGSGHTDTDLIVYFKNADVLQTGDIWWNGHYPFIDYGGGGGIDGMIRWTNECLKLTTASSIIIPGHGSVGDRSQLSAYRDMLVNVRDTVARLKKEGKTLAEVIAARPTAAYDKQYGDFVIDPAFFIQLVYMGV